MTLLPGKRLSHTQRHQLCLPCHSSALQPFQGKIPEGFRLWMELQWRLCLLGWGQGPPKVSATSGNPPPPGQYPQGFRTRNFPQETGGGGSDAFQPQIKFYHTHTDTHKHPHTSSRCSQNRRFWSSSFFLVLENEGLGPSGEPAWTPPAAGGPWGGSGRQPTGKRYWPPCLLLSVEGVGGGRGARTCIPLPKFSLNFP